MRRLLVVVAVLVVLAIAGTLLSRGAHRTADRSAAAAAVRSPAGTANGGVTVPESGFVDVEAARRAAVDAVSLTDEVVKAGFISRRDLVASFTTKAYGPTLAAETSEQIKRLLSELGERDADVSQVGAG
jgi:hypothetical protein